MIYINGRFLLQNQTGVNRFAYQICKALNSIGVKFQVLCPKGEVKNCYDISGFDVICFGRFQSHLWEQISLPLYWKSIHKKHDLLLNFTSVGPVLIKNKFITIHDLAFVENPAWYSCLYVLAYRILTPLSIKTSKHILTVSEFSKGEIMKFYDVPDDNISVIYNSSSEFPDKLEVVRDVCENYVLAVSSIDPRKNFDRLLKAFGRVQDKSLYLYIVGGYNNVFASSKFTSSPQVRWLGRVEDEELRWYYQNATCFVYPSLYEGFGIPPLESMSYGTPVIASEIPPLREVCGDAAYYVDPQDDINIASAIDHVCSKEELREQMITRGFIRCKGFSWEKSAQKLRDVISQYIARESI